MARRGVATPRPYVSLRCAQLTSQLARHLLLRYNRSVQIERREFTELYAYLRI